MRVESRVAEVCLGAVAAFEVAALDVVLRAALALAAVVAVLAVVVLIEVVAAVCLLPLGPARHILHWALAFAESVHVGHARVACRELAAAGLSVRHHVLARPVVHIAHLHHLGVAGPVAVGAVGRGLVKAGVMGHEALAGLAAGHHVERWLAHEAWLAIGAHLRLTCEMVLVTALEVVHLAGGVLLLAVLLVVHVGAVGGVV